MFFYWHTLYIDTITNIEYQVDNISIVLTPLITLVTSCMFVYIEVHVLLVMLMGIRHLLMND